MALSLISAQGCSIQDSLQSISTQDSSLAPNLNNTPRPWLHAFRSSMLKIQQPPKQQLVPSESAEDLSEGLGRFNSFSCSACKAKGCSCVSQDSGKNTSPQPSSEGTDTLNIALVGNPNSGKTTLFNAYTGANLKVANWPGVTVEKVAGVVRSHNMHINLVDLPGTYALTSYNSEEVETRDYICSDQVDLIINVVDASSLERSLYLTLQLLELGKPVILALNMMDIVIRRGMEIDMHRLPEMLGIPVISISARKKRGLEVLLHTACHHKDKPVQGEIIHDHAYFKPEYRATMAAHLAKLAQEHKEPKANQDQAQASYEVDATVSTEQGVQDKVVLTADVSLDTSTGTTISSNLTDASVLDANSQNEAVTPTTKASQDNDSAIYKESDSVICKEFAQTHGHHKHNHHHEFAMVYTDQIEDKIDLIMPKLKELYPQLTNLRYYAIKLLENDSEVSAKYPVDLPYALDRSYESMLINQKFDFISEVIAEVVLNKQRQAAFTQNIDRYLTHSVLGIPIFLCLMAFIFFLTFYLGDWLKGYIADALAFGANYVEAMLNYINAGPMLNSLVLTGIIGGVGTIITFLPNILILFLCLAFLEDSGYMSRVAYIMESLMGRLGLSGSAFIPMLIGFGCTVPAIMASRSLKIKRDRFKVMLVTPFMSCNARLTVYILFSAMFFPDHSMLVAYSLYLIGLIVAILVSFIVHLLDRKQHINYLLIELPEYKLPDLHTVSVYVWDKIKDYVEQAGTSIFIATLIIWAVLNFNLSGYVTDMRDSFGAMLGQVLAPLFEPVGLGFWQIVVALIAGLSAKEVVVSSSAVLFGISDTSTTEGAQSFAMALESIGFSQLNAFCLMVFCLLYVPCVATLATIRKESHSTTWMWFTVAFQLCTAYLVTLLIYQVGCALS